MSRPEDTATVGRDLPDSAAPAPGYTPRGTTPLYDAIGALLARVDAHVAAGGHDADQVVVVLTDGLENASTEYTRRRIFDLVTERRGRGWTFAFLGANQDSYEAGTAMAIAGPSTASWDATPVGAHDAILRVSAATARRVRGSRASRMATRDAFFEGEEPPAGE
jgi:Mg-chelatase subunit ChlD